MSIKVKAAGLSTSVQDLGRNGYYHLGIPQSGAMDRYALRLANMLVGNNENDAALEAVFTGPELEFTEDAIIAVTGAELTPKVDGVLQDTWTSFRIKAGQTLSFDFLQSGARAYIAISGGIDVPIVLGSRSTYALGGLGGYKGRVLAPGDELQIGKTNTSAVAGKTITTELRRQNQDVAELRVLPGIYWHRITTDAQQQFFADSWKVAPEADRIGYRFRGGKAMEFVARKQPFGAGSDPSNIVDSCYPYGSIQVPSGAEPIVLHRDAVSGGGYFMIGAVISPDLDLIAQLQPNAQVNFVKVDMDEAIITRNARHALLQQVRSLFTL